MLYYNYILNIVKKIFDKLSFTKQNYVYWCQLKHLENKH